MLGRGWAERGAAGAAALHGALAGIYRRRGGLWLSFALHLGCWIASAVEVWLALRLAGQPLPFSAVLAIESLLYAIRTVCFCRAATRSACRKAPTSCSAPASG